MNGSSHIFQFWMNLNFVTCIVCHYYVLLHIIVWIVTYYYHFCYYTQAVITLLLRIITSFINTDYYRSTVFVITLLLRIITYYYIIHYYVLLLHCYIIITHYYLIIITYYYNIITTYYFIVITSLLRHYYVIVMSLFRMEETGNNERIITYYTFSMFLLLHRDYPLLPWLPMITCYQLGNLQMTTHRFEHQRIFFVSILAKIELIASEDVDSGVFFFGIMPWRQDNSKKQASCSIIFRNIYLVTQT